jgi:lycopene cyclase domain-containing protein
VTYTAAACLGVGFALLLDLGILRTKLLRRKAFWVAYAIVFGFQLLVNGILTGRRLVVYDPHAVLGGATPRLLGGWRIAYAPVEDLLFGFSMVVQTLAWWVWWERRARRARRNAGPNTASRRRVPTETRRSSTR